MRMKLYKRDIILIGITTFALLTLSLVGWLVWGLIILPFSISLATCAILLIHMEVYRRQQVMFGRESYQNYRQIEALISLVSLLRLKRPLPPLRRWAISPDTGNMIVSAIFNQRPKVVVECGSGVSTLLVGYCLKQLGQGMVLSLEQDEKYAHITRSNLRSHGVEDRAKVVHAPLKKLSLNGKSWFWYDTTILDEVQSVDLLIVDGPVVKPKDMERYPAGPLLFEKLTDNAVVILDDAARADEKKVVEA